MADAADTVPAAEIDAMVDAKAAEATNILSEDQQSKVKRQVEFYFSVSNLPRDKYVVVRFLFVCVCCAIVF